MLKKVLFIVTIVILMLGVSGLVYAGKITKVPIEQAGAPNKNVGNENAVSDTPGIPYSGDDITQSPGIIVGRSWYDFQTNGSTGTRVVKHLCGTHMCWMNSNNQTHTPRQIYYNFINNSGTVMWGEDGTPVSQGTRDGYTTMDVTADGRACIVYHDATSQADYKTQLALDAACGFGLFTISIVPSEYPGDINYIWPYVAVDYNDRIQVTNNEGEVTGGVASGIAHTFSADYGGTWSPLYRYSEEQAISPIMVASPVDDKVAILWSHVREPELNSQRNNDVVYIESLDGETWDYRTFTNVTNYQDADTVRAYADVDAIYDLEGNLHIVWNTHGYWYDQGPSVTVDACFLWHWSEASGINMVYNAWHESFCGTWNLSASKPSIACDGAGNLYVLFTHFDNVDVAENGFSNGELYLASSYDGGYTWEDSNLTNTQTIGCSAGDCESEHWSSLAEETYDNYLHILYIEDKDAGAGVLAAPEGVVTENPVRYHEIPIFTSVDEEEEIPSLFVLNQNYPNPFNTSTEIKYSLKQRLDVSLKVYNIRGELVGTLVDAIKEAGGHSVTWNAVGYSSGIYFYRLEAGNEVKTMRMALLK